LLERGLDHRRLGEISLIEKDAGHFGLVKAGVLEPGLPETGAFDPRVAQIGSDALAALEAAALKIRAPEPAVGQVAVPENDIDEDGLFEMTARKAALPEEAAPDFERLEIFFPEACVREEDALNRRFIREMFPG